MEYWKSELKGIVVQNQASNFLTVPSPHNFRSRSFGQNSKHLQGELKIKSITNSKILKTPDWMLWCSNSQKMEPLSTRMLLLPKNTEILLKSKTSYYIPILVPWLKFLDRIRNSSRWFRISSMNITTALQLSHIENPIIMVFSLILWPERK